jgi:hypothetical protein
MVRSTMVNRSHVGASGLPDGHRRSDYERTLAALRAFITVSSVTAHGGLGGTCEEDIREWRT